MKTGSNYLVRDAVHYLQVKPPVKMTNVGSQWFFSVLSKIEEEDSLRIVYFHWLMEFILKIDAVNPTILV